MKDPEASLGKVCYMKRTKQFFQNVLHWPEQEGTHPVEQCGRRSVGAQKKLDVN